MSGRRADGSPLGADEAPDEWFYLHHTSRLLGIPMHEINAWEPGWKRAQYVSVLLQLERENERLAAGIGVI